MEVKSNEALTLALKILTRRITKDDFILVDTKVRCNGHLLEWYLNNGELVEVYQQMEYSLGVPSIRQTSVTHYQEVHNNTYKVLFSENFLPTLTE